MTDVLVLRNASVLCTMDGPGEDPLGRIPDGALVAEDHVVTWVGPSRDLPRVPGDVIRLDADGGAVLPGLVECHTHVVFGGDRVEEYGRRARGETYQQIAAGGGGIMTTVRATRAAPESALVESALPRLAALLHHGVTTCEVKSGYGLTLADELKMLRAVKVLGALQPVELIPTFLGAHTCPPEYAGDRDRYITHVVDEMLPVVVQAGLARFVDIFVEQGAFTPEHARRLAAAARRLGLGLKLHVDQLGAGGGAELASELKATSADHLDHASEAGVRAMREAGVVAVLLPTAQVFLGHRGAAPGRAMREAGVTVAVSTDYNPGTSPCAHLPLAATLAVSQCGLTVEEALLGVTRSAADAVGRRDLGRVKVGGPCDLVVLKRPDPGHLLYEMGGEVVRTVVKEGKVVVGGVR
jgi:imidazolonepropionase